MNPRNPVERRVVEGHPDLPVYDVLRFCLTRLCTVDNEFCAGGESWATYGFDSSDADPGWISAV